MALEPDQLQAMWRDLVERVDALAAERDQYVHFFERSPDAYVLTDAAGVIVEVNGAAVDILQRRRRELRERPLAAMIALDRRADFRGRITALAAGDVPARWHSVVESPGLRTDVVFTARLFRRTAGVAGICWLLQAGA